MSNTSFEFSLEAEEMHAGAAEWQGREDELAEGWRMLGIEPR